MSDKVVVEQHDLKVRTEMLDKTNEQLYKDYLKCRSIHSLAARHKTDYFTMRDLLNKGKISLTGKPLKNYHPGVRGTIPLPTDPKELVLKVHKIGSIPRASVAFGINIAKLRSIYNRAISSIGGRQPKRKVKKVKSQKPKRLRVFANLIKLNELEAAKKLLTFYLEKNAYRLRNTALDLGTSVRMVQNCAKSMNIEMPDPIEVKRENMRRVQAESTKARKLQRKDRVNSVKISALEKEIRELRDLVRKATS